MASKISIKPHFFHNPWHTFKNLTVLKHRHHHRMVSLRSYSTETCAEGSACLDASILFSCLILSRSHYSWLIAHMAHIPSGPCPGFSDVFPLSFSDAVIPSGKEYSARHGRLPWDRAWIRVINGSIFHSLFRSAIFFSCVIVLFGSRVSRFFFAVSRFSVWAINKRNLSTRMVELAFFICVPFA